MTVGEAITDLEVRLSKMDLENVVIPGHMEKYNIFRAKRETAVNDFKKCSWGMKSIELETFVRLALRLYRKGLASKEMLELLVLRRFWDEYFKYDMEER